LLIILTCVVSIEASLPKRSDLISVIRIDAGATTGREKCEWKHESGEGELLRHGD